MRNIYIAVIVSIVALLFVGCSKGDTNIVESGDAVLVKHELDETAVPKNPEKVIVFDFGVLDTLDKLDIEVTGVPQNNIPAYLEKYEGKEYENVGGLKEPDFEKIANIDPDVIIISGRQADIYDQLSDIAPTIHLGIDNNDYMKSFEKNLNVIGEIFEKETEVKEAFETIEASIADLKEEAASLQVNSLIILANEDKISAYGPKSRFGIIHDVFGVPAVDEDIEISTHGANVTFEYVLEKDPDILYVVDRGAAVGGESSAKQIVENKLMERSKAYQNDNIIYLSPDYWYLSGGGIKSVTEMINEIEASLK